jgi:hypothetical protein
VAIAVIAALTMTVQSVNAQEQAQIVQENIEIRGYYGKCLTGLGSEHENNTPVQMWDCDDNPDKGWDIYSDGTIRSKSHGKCLHIPGPWNGNTTPVQMRDCVAGVLNQQWIVPDASHPTSEIWSYWQGGYCLDVTGPYKDNGTPVQMWECKGPEQDNQQFHRTRIVAESFRHEWINKFDSMEYSPSARARMNELMEIRHELLNTFSDDQGRNMPDGRWVSRLVMDHADLGQLLGALAQRDDISFNEKGLIWSRITSVSWHGRSEVQNYSIGITHINAHPLVINADWLGTENTYRHTAVSFTDEHHGNKVRIPLDQAYAKIAEYEDNWQCEPFCPNRGDIEASLRTVIALRELDKTRDFKHFARYWWGLFVDHDQTFCEQRIYEDGCPTIGLGPGLEPVPAGYIPEEQWCALVPCEEP